MPAVRDNADNEVGRAAAASHCLCYCCAVHAISLQPVSLHQYESGGITSEVHLLDIPGVMFSEDYASLGTFFMLFVQIVPAFCLVVILLLVNRVQMPRALKIRLARILFQLKSWGMAEIFLAGILVSFVKLMAYGDVGVGSSFIPWCLYCVLQLRVSVC